MPEVFFSLANKQPGKLDILIVLNRLKFCVIDIKSNYANYIIKILDRTLDDQKYNIN